MSTSIDNITAIANIKVAANKSKVLGDTSLEIHRPNSTPTKLVAIKAVPAPTNTLKGDRDWAAINMVANWVLSPISAKKMVINVDNQTPQAPLFLVTLGGVEVSEGVIGAESDTILFSYFSHFLSIALFSRQPTFPVRFSSDRESCSCHQTSVGGSYQTGQVECSSALQSFWP